VLGESGEQGNGQVGNEISRHGSLAEENSGAGGDTHQRDIETRDDLKRAKVRNRIEARAEFSRGAGQIGDRLTCKKNAS